MEEASKSHNVIKILHIFNYRVFIAIVMATNSTNLVAMVTCS